MRAFPRRFAEATRAKIRLAHETIPIRGGYFLHVPASTRPNMLALVHAAEILMSPARAQQRRCGEPVSQAFAVLSRRAVDLTTVCFLRETRCVKEVVSLKRDLERDLRHRCLRGGHEAARWPVFPSPVCCSDTGAAADRTIAYKVAYQNGRELRRRVGQGCRADLSPPSDIACIGKLASFSHGKYLPRRNWA